MRNIIEATIESFPEFILRKKLKKWKKEFSYLLKFRSENSISEIRSACFDSIGISASRKIQEKLKNRENS